MIPISCLDTPNLRERHILYPNLVTPQWVRERRREWGEASPLYESRVLGRFPTASEYGLIPLQWLLDANERARQVSGGPLTMLGKEGGRRVGVDVARSGADATVFVLREGNRVCDVEEHRHLKVTETVGKLVLFVERHLVAWEQVYVDVIGVGAGVVDCLAEQGRRVVPVNFGSGARDSKRYANCRAECYWRLRNALRPDAEAPLVIPERFGALGAELVAIEWSVTSAGQTLVEPKEKIKARIGRSPDHADALALTFMDRSKVEIDFFGLDGNDHLHPDIDPDLDRPGMWSPVW